MQQAQGILRELWRRGCEVCSPASRRGVPRRASAWARGAGARGEVFFGASWRGRGREARRGLQPSDVRSFLRCAAANEGAEANDLQPGGDRRVSAWAKTRRPAASLTSGGLGRLGSSVAIWLGLCVSASGDASKTAAAVVVAWREGRAPLGFRVDDAARRPSLRHVLWHVLRNALRRVLHVLVFNVLPKGGVGAGMRVLGVGSAAGRR